MHEVAPKARRWGGWRSCWWPIRLFAKTHASRYSRHSLPYHNTTRYAQREGEGLASKDGKAAVDPRLRGAALGVGSEVS